MDIIEHDLTPDELAARLAALRNGPFDDGVPPRPTTDAEFAELPVLDLAAVRAAVADQRIEDVAAVVERVATRYRYVRPFAASADALIDYLQNPEGRFMLGLREIDVMTRGFGRGELCYITGFAHSGKTQLFLTGLVNNRHRPVVLFTLDEPSELVLAKLVSLRKGWNFEWVEAEIKAENKDVIRQVRDVAATDFANLVVVDESLSLGQMADAMKEAEDFLQRKVDAVGIDYLDLLRDGDDTEGKSQAVKRWTKDHDVATICVHQGGKGESAKGQPITLATMRFGGHAEAIFVLGCRRKRDDESLDEWERTQHADTISVSVVKNKRPPSKRGEHDYLLDPESGLIHPRPEPAPTGVAAAVKVRQEARYGLQDEEMF